MTSLLLVPAKGQESALRQKIAGLSLAQRLYHHAKRAGLSQTAFIVSEEEGLSTYEETRDCLLTDFARLRDKGFERCIVCNPTHLPDIHCLKWLLKVEIKDHEVLELPGVFVFSPSDNGFELKKAFENDGYNKLLDFLHTFLTRRQAICGQGQVFDVSGPERIRKVERVLFRSLIKDTEGFMSRFVERRISLAISKRLVNTSITPNQVTLVSILIGLVGAWFISLGRGLWQVTGAVLFLVHSIVDGCDGEIARIKFQESRLGGILDFWGDNIVHAAVFTAIGIEWWRRTGSLLPLFLSSTAVMGTFLCALMIYLSTMREKKAPGPLYTSVSTSSNRAGIVKIADFLSRRDFIYLVVILAWYQHLDWFLMASAIGTIVFLAMLIWIKAKD